MKQLLVALCCILWFEDISQTFTKTQYHEDFEFFWQTINDNYCYFDKRQVNWLQLKPTYEAQVDTVSCRSGFVSVLEHALYELYDHHIGLNTNNQTSRRLVPTATDVWAEYENDTPVITEVRQGFGAAKKGVLPGMQVVAINDTPVAKAIIPFLSHTINDESKSFALRLALAGNHIDKRKLTLRTGAGNVLDFYPDADSMMLENISYPAMTESKVVAGNIGYLKINNYLFDRSLIKEFDSALNTLLTTKALIIDLRETPSGGNTSVARAILGRFINKEHFYQKHELYAEEKATGIKRSWEEIVSPRGYTYAKPVVILVDHWTGSVSEGIAIAFDGMKRATVVGTEMARLNGAIEGFELPNTRIGCNIAVERLYHINGKPRELYEPAIKVDVTKQKQGDDLIMQTAINYLKRI